MKLGMRLVSFGSIIVVFGILMLFFLNNFQRRKLGDDEIDGDLDAIEWKDDNTISNLNGNKIIKKRESNDDHLVRETKEKKVVSREQTDERLETQDIQHFGDFSDEVGLNQKFY